jgi:hypothetical protein
MKSLSGKVIILLIIVLLGSFGATPLTSHARSGIATLTPLGQYAGAATRVTVAGSYA